MRLLVASGLFGVAAAQLQRCDDLAQQVKDINRQCCFTPNGKPLNCRNGPPVQCTAACSGYFVPFWEECSEKAGYRKSQKAKFDAFHKQCKATLHDDQGENDVGKNVLDPKLCVVKRSAAHNVKFNWIEISPHEMSACVKPTPQEQLKCPPPPPRKGITSKDVGIRIRDKDWTSGGQTTWQGDDGWYDVKLPWGFMYYGRSERKITIGTNGIITFGTPQYIYGGSEPVPCHGSSRCGDGDSHGIGVDGVIAVMWTDLDPTKNTPDAQQQCDNADHMCHGGGAVYYKINSDHVVVEYAKVESWSWKNQYSLKDPGQTFEVILHRDGDIKMQYLDTYCEHCTTAWSTVSIGFEDQLGERGQQIEYGDIPPDRSAFLVPRVCHTSYGPGGDPGGNSPGGGGNH